MLSKDEDSSLLAKLDDEEAKWWSSYTLALTEDDDWELSNSATLAIAYLVESGRLTYEEYKQIKTAIRKAGNIND